MSFKSMAKLFWTETGGFLLAAVVMGCVYFYVSRPVKPELPASAPATNKVPAVTLTNPGTSSSVSFSATTNSTNK